MAGYKIDTTGGGTGTFTIATPNSNTDRTITLPDEAGTVLTSASDLPAANLTGSLPAGMGGKVLQVVTVTDSSNWVTTTGTTLLDTGLAASITPTSSSSTILVMSAVNNIRINGTCQLKMDLQRQIAGGGYSTIEAWDELLGYSDNTTASVTPWFIDTPNTTSQVDYKYRFALRSGSCTLVYQNRVYDGGAGASNIILMEIAA